MLTFPLDGRISRIQRALMHQRLDVAKRCYPFFCKVLSPKDNIHCGAKCLKIASFGWSFRRVLSKEWEYLFPKIVSFADFKSVTERVTWSSVFLNVDRATTEEYLEGLEQCSVLRTELEVKPRLHQIPAVGIRVDAEGKTTFAIHETDNVIGRELHKRGSFGS